MMPKDLHSRDAIDKLYVSRKGVAKGLAIVQDSVDASIQQLKDYIKNPVED